MNSDYTLLFPSSIEWVDFETQKPDIPFSEKVVNCLNDLSKELLEDRESRMYPDVVTFAFFCRKSNLIRLKERYVDANVIRLGRGLIFHIAPSNVPINFGYSLVAGLLAGNINVVRVSSKTFPQVDLIISHLYKLLQTERHKEILKRIVLLRYDRNSNANSFLSGKCNVRVIWGGDQTIAAIRKNPLPPRSFDVCFADRYSISVLDPQAILTATESNLRRLSEAFYNDTYLFDQNACSAPHTIFWLNDKNIREAKKRFWTSIHSYASAKYQFQPIMAIDKLTAFYRQAVSMDIKNETMPDNVVIRVELNDLPDNIEDFRCACGYFSEFVIDRLDDIASTINIKYQTLGYYGLNKEELRSFVLENHICGLDRIVPIGETTAFSLTWDGYNLIDTFTREVSIL